MRIVRAASLIAVLVVGGCASLVPAETPGSSSILVSPAASGSPTASFGTLVSPSASLPLITLAPASIPPVTEPPVTEPPVTEPPTPAPTKTPKPTRPPTPSPSPIGVDLAVFVQTSDIPNPWYTDTDYVIPIYVTTSKNVPNAHVNIKIVEEAFSTSFDTGPIGPSDNFHQDVTFNLSAMGPATWTLAVKAPPGYVDIFPDNNKVSIAIEVSPKP